MYGSLVQRCGSGRYAGYSSVKASCRALMVAQPGRMTWSQHREGAIATTAATHCGRRHAEASYWDVAVSLGADVKVVLER